MQRQEMPSRRQCVTQKADVGKWRTYLNVGLKEDGQPGELFLSVEGGGAEVRLLYDVIARCVSVGLQCGIPLEKYVDMFLGVRGEMAGPVRHHERIKMAQSVLDYVARELAIQYLGRDDLAHAPGKEPEHASADAGAVDPSVD